MQKVTLNENLVPSREPWVKGYPGCDLVHNYLHARKLIRAASFYFQLRKGVAVFSGYINEHDEGFFTMGLYHQGALVQTLVLGSLGYAGVLRVEIDTPNLAEAMNFDFLGDLARRSGATPALAVIG